MQVLPESGRNTSVDVPADDDVYPPVTKIPEIIVSLWPHFLKTFFFKSRQLIKVPLYCSCLRTQQFIKDNL